MRPAAALIFFGLIFVSGCAHLLPPPDDQPDARRVVERLRGANADLIQFKGLAHMRLESESQLISGRIAYAAVRPDKMRIELLNMMGQPLTSLAGDGRHITIFMRSDGKTHRLRQSPAALERLIHIPIGIEDLQRIMAGTIPIPEDSAVQIQVHDDSKEIIVFKDRWRRTLAKLTMDTSTGQPSDMQFFDGRENLQYRIQWLSWHCDGIYRLPRKMVFLSESRQRLTLTMDRFWPNADIPLSTFEIDTPQHSGSS